MRAIALVGLLSACSLALGRRPPPGARGPYTPCDEGTGLATLDTIGMFGVGAAAPIAGLLAERDGPAIGGILGAIALVYGASAYRGFDEAEQCWEVRRLPAGRE